MLAQSAYGKFRVRLVQVQRRGSRHDLRDLTVGISFRGQYDEAYTDGDNRAVLPTDTMKNTVYALAAQRPVECPEQLGLALAERFLERNPRLTRVRIDLTEHLWTRLPRGEREHDHAFSRKGPETRTAVVSANRRRSLVGAGIADLLILKSAHSAFDNFLHDEYTTLPDTRDRILATSLTATWHYATPDVDFTPAWQAARRVLLEVFADHHSESVQHTLYAMGQAVLDSIDAIKAIRLVMPNKHHLPFDLRPLGLDNRNEIFVPTDEPHGLIEATLVR
ncbi:MAG TPA: urate oxidase [Vicinamibacterales bacterium]|nr:urate oxidase [Vicinamibacterales bacterium]